MSGTPRLNWSQLLMYLISWSLLTGCEHEAERAPRNLPAGGLWISVVTPSEYAPDWPAVSGGARRYLETTPTVSGECVAARANETVTAFAQRFLDRKPAAVVLLVPSREAAEPLARIVRAALVPLVTVGEELPDGVAAGHVAVFQGEAAETLAAALPSVVGTGLSYVLVRKGAPAEGTERVSDRFMSVARQNPSPRLLAADEGDGVNNVAAAVSRLLAQYPRTSLVVTLDPAVWLDPPLGWEAGLAQVSPSYRFATLSAAPRLWAALGTPQRPGRAAALVGALDGERGFAAAELAVRIALNPETPRRRIIPTELVTAATLADFARRYSQAAGGLDVSSWLPRGVVATNGTGQTDEGLVADGQRRRPDAAPEKSFGPPAEADGP